MSQKEEIFDIIDKSWGVMGKSPGREKIKWINSLFPPEDCRPTLFKALALLGLEENYRANNCPTFAAFRNWWITHSRKPTIKGCMHSSEHAPALEYADGRIITFSPTSHSESQALETAKGIYQNLM